MASSPVYALVGADSFLQTEQLSKLLASLGKHIQRIDLDGDRAGLADVLDEVRSFAMFGGAGSTKVVVVRNAEEFVERFREQLDDYLASPVDTAALVLRCSTLPKTTRIYKLIDKMKGIIACEPPPQGQLAKWAIERVKSHHRATIEPEAAEQLAQLIGQDLGRLDNELAKLAVQAEGGKITRSEVERGVAFQRERDMWEFTVALGVGDVTEAVRRWRQLLQTEPGAEFRGVTWLSIWLEDVRGAVEALAAGGRPDYRKMWRYKGRENDFIATCRRLGGAGCARALDLLTEVDRANKSGVGEPARNVERFLLSVLP